MSLAETVQDVLSAASFPDTLPGDDGPSVPSYGSASALYGGILICNNDEPTREGNPRHKKAHEEPSRKKKAQAKEKSAKRSQSEMEAGAGGMSKKRGRPRVDPADETASERRRTQVRLAQRAYRLRKESVISSLHQRVEDLEKTVEEMNKTFLSFNDEAMGSGILSSHPQLARQLHRATQRFLTLAKVASPDSTLDDDDDEENGADMTEDIYELAPEEWQAHSQTPSYNPLGSVQHSNHSQVLDSFQVGELNNAPVVPQSGLVQQSVNGSKAFPSNLVSQELQDRLFREPFFNSCVHIPETKIPPSIDAPGSATPLAQYTNSFLETSFARRLQRRCLEAGYSLLTNPSCDPTKVKKTFMLSLNVSSQSRLANAFLFLLQQKAGEPLEFLNAPSFSIGGAGTHYPRRDERGNVIYPPNLYPPEKALERLGLRGLENVNSGQRVQEIMELLGLGGQWFDCNDVEGYMSSKGIQLDSSSLYAELPVPILEPPYGAYSSPSSALSNSLEPEGPAAPTAPTLDPEMSSSYTPPDFTSFGYSILSPSCYAPQNGPHTQELNLLGINGQSSIRSGNIDSLTQPCLDTQNSGTAAMFPNCARVMDVDRFIDKLIPDARCLGRAPAFKQTNVDAALASSISLSC